MKYNGEEISDNEWYVAENKDGDIENDADREMIGDDADFLDDIGNK